jgi:hypothetical protein
LRLISDSSPRFSRHFFAASNTTAKKSKNKAESLLNSVGLRT